MPPKKERRIGPFGFSYTPSDKKRNPTDWDFSFGLALFVTTVMVVFGHETAYRILPAEDRDYPLLGFISHFGADMLIVGGVVAIMAVLLLHWRENS